MMCYRVRNCRFVAFLILLSLAFGVTPGGAVYARPAPARATNAAIAAATETAVNKNRLAQGLAPLRHSDLLAQIAQAYAERMGREKFFSHTDPQGGTIGDRAVAVSYDYAVLGENLAQVKVAPGKETDFVVAGWMSSATHRSNICCEKYVESATGVFCAPDGTIYIVQVFGATF